MFKNKIIENLILCTTDKNPNLVGVLPDSDLYGDQLHINEKPLGDYHNQWKAVKVLNKYL